MLSRNRLTVATGRKWRAGSSIAPRQKNRGRSSISRHGIGAAEKSCSKVSPPRSHPSAEPAPISARAGVMSSRYSSSPNRSSLEKTIRGDDPPATTSRPVRSWSRGRNDAAISGGTWTERDRAGENEPSRRKTRAGHGISAIGCSLNVARIIAENRAQPFHELQLPSLRWMPHFRVRDPKPVERFSSAIPDRDYLVNPKHLHQ